MVAKAETFVKIKIGRSQTLKHSSTSKPEGRKSISIRQNRIRQVAKAEAFVRIKIDSSQELKHS